MKLGSSHRFSTSRQRAVRLLTSAATKSRILLSLLALAPLSLAALHEWSFDEPAGVSLRYTDNSRQPLVNWTVSWANSQTTGEGVFRVQRNGGSQNTRFDVGDTDGAEYVYYVATIAGWDFSHTTGNAPLFRFSFMNGPAADTPSEITAEAVLESIGAAGVTLRARALGTGGTSSPTTNLFPAARPEPVTLAIAYSEALNRYEVHYRNGLGPWTLFYAGTTSGQREGTSLRMQVAGDFDGAGENFLDLDRVRLTAQTPVSAAPPAVMLNDLREEAGTTWDLEGSPLSIGSGAGQTGELLIGQGGRLDSDLVFVGDTAGATGSLTVGGETSVWEAENADVFIGNESGSEGTVEIASGGLATGARTIHAGRRGDGALDVIGGGTLSANSIYVGSGDGAVGVLDVSGAGSRVDLGRNLRVGANGVLAPAGSSALVRVQQEGVVHVGGDVAIRSGGSISIESGGSLIAEGGLDMGGQGVGGFLGLDGGTLTVGGPLDLSGATGFAWTQGVIVAKNLVTGFNLVTSNNVLFLDGPDAFFSNNSTQPLLLGSGAAIEGSGTVFHPVNLGLHGSGAIRGFAESRLRILGTVTGMGVLEQARVNGTIAPARGTIGITLRDVSFAAGSALLIDISSGAPFPRIFFDEETDFSNVRLEVRFSGAPPSPSDEFEILQSLGDGSPWAFFKGISLPSGWELEEGTLVYSGAPPVETYEQWAEAHGLSGDAAAPSADPDGDGSDNRTEFFFGGNPLGTAGPLLRAFREGDAAVLRWRQRNAGDVVYGFDRSDNLVTWAPANEVAAWKPLANPPAPHGYRWVEVELEEQNDRAFYRVRAAPAPSLPVYPGKTWDYIDDPEEEGVPAATIAECIQILNGMDTTGFMAIKGGRVLFDYGDLSFVSYSASTRKSILSMLFGKYVESGAVDLFETLGEIGIDDNLGLLPIERQANVHDLLRARSGVYHPRSNTGDNWDQAPPRGSQIPGNYYLYNNWDFNALGTIFTVKTGKTPYEALETDFARPLQMEDFSLAAQRWGGNKSLSVHLAYYYHLSTRDMARLGYLMLRNGVWAGEQIIPEFWMEQSLFPWTPSQQMNPASRRSQGFSYSYLWWLREVEEESPYYGSYAAHGAGGQYIMVIPKLDLVLAHKTNSSGTSLSVSRTQFYNLADVLVQGMTQ